jgi:hypothetical protein
VWLNAFSWWKTYGTASQLNPKLYRCRMNLVRNWIAGLADQAANPGVGKPWSEVQARLLTGARDADITARVNSVYGEEPDGLPAHPHLDDVT